MILLLCDLKISLLDLTRNPNFLRSTSNNFFSNPLGKYFTVEFYKRFKKKIKNDEFLDCTGSSQKLVEGIRTKTISVQIHLRWDFNETGTDEVPKLYVRLRSKMYQNVQVLWSLLKNYNCIGSKDVENHLVSSLNEAIRTYLCEIMIKSWSNCRKRGENRF